MSIESEIKRAITHGFTRYFAQNFETLGLKKLISTSYAPESKAYKQGYQLSLFETNSPKFDKDKTKTHDKIFVLTEDSSGDGVINLDDLQWDYLDGDGDFRSKEVTRLRDEADIIVTNPPFSLFREFVAWIMEAHKEFVVIGNQNAITYKEIFPLLMHNQIWLGVTGFSRDMVFGVPEGTIVKESDKKKAERLGYVGNYTRLGNSCWFTNIEHGRRHQLKWVSKGRVEDYMQEHRWDANINELKNHFNDVINWIESIFDEVYPQMKGLNWGELYDRFHNNPYNHIEVSQKVRDLLCDPCVGDRKNVFEYVLGGSGDTKLLNIRVFEESTKHRVYDRQTKEAKASGISNCPLCAIGHDANRQRIWKLTDMDADHVRAWSKGGATEESNCQMLCRTHNRAKGNR